MMTELKAVSSEARDLCDLSQEELIVELRLCHEMFRRCYDLLCGRDAEPVELMVCPELGDSDDMELYYKCLAIHDTREELE